MTTPIDPMAAAKVLRQAMEDICNPIAAMQRDLEEGYTLNGAMAVAMCDKPQHYKDIAAKALAATAHVESPTSEPVRYELRMVAPNGKPAPWGGTSKEAFDKFRANPDIGDGFRYDVRALHDHATPQALPATEQSAHVTQISKCSACNGTGHVEIEQAKPLTSNGVDYIMDAVHCYAQEWALFFAGASHRNEKHKQAEGTKARIRRMLEDVARHQASPAKPDLSGLTDEQAWDAMVDECGVEHVSGSGTYAKHGIVIWTPRQAGEVARAILATKPVAQAKPDASVGFDFHAHLARQAAFSLKTFGPGMRTAGVCDHIRKELLEIEADPLDLREWIDVVILALDGAWRCGGSPSQIIGGIVAKQTKNEGRNWPDWRTADPNKAIEHDRSGEGFRVGATTSKPDAEGGA
jgi:hypothetical protein